MRRLLLALDALNCEAARIEAAAALATALGAELEALFVEDDDLYAAAALPITQEISSGSARERELSSASLASALRAISREAESRVRSALARGQLQGGFRVMRGRRSEALGEASEGADVLLLPAARTVVHLRLRAQASPKVFAICGPGAAGARTIALAARLAKNTHQPLELVCAGDPGSAAQHIPERAGLHAIRHDFAAATPLIQLLDAVDGRAGNTLLVATDIPAAADRAALLEQVSALRCEVLLVN